MKIFALAGAGATLALGAWLTSAQTGSWRPPVVHASQSPAGKALSVRRASGGKVCALEPEGGSRFSAAPDCTDVADNLSGRLDFQEGEGGTAWLSDRSGRIVLEFSEGEGGLYESVRPTEPLLLLDTGA